MLVTKRLEHAFGMDWGNLGYYGYNARFYNPAIGRFSSIDPLAEKYMPTSPYLYVANNPLKYIDPTGMSYDNYELNKETGTITLMGKTDEEFDRLFVKSENAGEGIMGDKLTYKSIIVNDQAILPQLAANPATDFNGHYGTTSNTQDAFNIFYLAATETSVEWGLDGYKTSDGNQFLLRTSHSKTGVSVTNGSFDKLDLKFRMHIHPGVNASTVASGWINRFGDTSSDGDFVSLAVDHNAFNAARKSYPSQFPKHYFYHQESKTLYQYNRKGETVKVGTFQSPKSLQNSILKKMINYKTFKNMKKIVFILLCISLISCKEVSNRGNSIKKGNDKQLEKVVIHFYPSFNLGSMIVWEVKKADVLFQRLGAYKKRIKLSFKPDDPTEEMSPLSIYYQLDSISSNYLKDSIHLKKEDFIDQTTPVEDGSGNIILYIYNDGSIIDVDTNSPTENQKKMISYLLDLTLTNTKDSLSQNYLSDLRKYY